MKTIAENGNSSSSSSVIEKYKPYIAMVFMQSVYAGMALFSKAAISKGMNPYIFVVYRQAFASIALAPFALLLERKKPPPLSNRLLCKIFLVSFCGLTLSLNLYNVGINNTTATFAAAATNIIPAMTFLMAVLFRMESVNIKKWHGIAKIVGSGIGVAGALVFAFVKGPEFKLLNWHKHSQQQYLASTPTDKEYIKGSLLMILGFLFWSLWFVLQGPIVKEYPAKLRLTALQCIFSFIQSAIGAVAIERNPSAWKLGWDLHLLSVAYCGILVSGICYWVQVWTIEKKGPVFTSTFTPLALIITAIVSALLWNETLRLGSVGGAILLVGGLYGVLWGKKKEEDQYVNNGPITGKEPVSLDFITLSHH